MNTFGLKAFLRAFAIFASVYLVKLGIDLIARTNDTFQRVGYSIAILVVILIIIFAPSLIPPTKRENLRKDRKAENEK